MKKIIIIMFLLLSGCTSKIDLDVKQDIGVVPKFDVEEPLQYFNESIFSEELLNEGSKSAWVKTYQQDVSYLASSSSYESLKGKVYRVLTPSGLNSFDVRAFLVDHSVDLLDDNPWYIRPSEFPLIMESESEEAYISRIDFKQLPNTPFFIIDQETSGLYGYQTSATEHYSNIYPIGQATGSTVLVEDSYLYRYSRLFFPASDGDIRSINLAALIEYFEYGSPTFESQSELSFRQEAFKWRDSHFLNESARDYLNDKYNTEVDNMYLDLNAFRSYI